VDAALVAEAISGHDPKDSTSLNIPKIRAQEVKNRTLKGLKLGVPKELWGDSNHSGIIENCQRAIEALQADGAEIKELSLPAIKFGVTTYYIIAPAEASSNLARFDGVRYGPRLEGKGHIDVVEKTRAALFGHEVKARIMIGTYALSAGYYDAYYLRAQQVRALMQQEFETAFQELDFIVSPTSPVPAFKIGELSKDPMALKLLDYCTIPANMGGFPAISLNCGFTEGLPVGFQFIGPSLSDELVLQAAYCAEQVFDASSRPPIP
jgi:aspartyl-tRNA(Asn)/glutamyl-tRNA(Gln) amidotransferase subunit A